MNKANLQSMLALLAACVVLISFVNSEFPTLRNIKSVREWQTSADSITTHDKSRWLSAEMLYYPNGEQKQILYLRSNGDTAMLQTYKLNKDSTLKKMVWYNTILKKWMEDDSYYYHEGERRPYMSKGKDHYKWLFTYNKRGDIIREQLSDNKDENLTEYEYTYDSSGLLAQKVEYGFFDEQREEKAMYVYEYEKDKEASVTKRTTYFVPHHTQQTVTKTDKKGNQRTTYYGFTASAKTVTETIYFNDKGERIKKIDYNRDHTPKSIFTYEYRYYK